jgi:hypothetical protein
MAQGVFEIKSLHYEHAIGLYIDYLYQPITGPTTVSHTVSPSHLSDLCDNPLESMGLNKGAAKVSATKEAVHACT